MARNDIEQLVRLMLMDGVLTEPEYLSDKLDIWKEQDFITTDMYCEAMAAIEEVCNKEWYKAQEAYNESNN